MIPVTHLLIFILLAILSYIGVYFIRRYAERRQMLDHPNERSSHSLPTPRGGGLAIVLIVIGTGRWVMKDAELNHALIYLVCGAVIAWLGWLMLSANMRNNFVFWIAFAIAASSLGFLGHNWSPA